MDAEIVDTKTGEMVQVQTGEVMVFGTTDTTGIIQKATEVANRLADIVEKGKLYSMIKDKKYVKAEGWTAMAAMMGVFPATEYCRKLERDDEIAYEAKIVLRHISGREVGSGEALCSSRERTWSGRDEYTIKSMAQTRAVGKACRLSFSWIMAMSGYEVTPAEEMIYDSDKPKVLMPKAKLTVEPEAVPEGTSKFLAQLYKVVREKNIPDETMKQTIAQMFHKRSSKDLTDVECAKLIKAVDGMPTHTV